MIYYKWDLYLKVSYKICSLPTTTMLIVWKVFSAENYRLCTFNEKCKMHEQYMSPPFHTRMGLNGWIFLPAGILSRFWNCSDISAFHFGFLHCFSSMKVVRCRLGYVLSFLWCWNCPKQYLYHHLPNVSLIPLQSPLFFQNRFDSAFDLSFFSSSFAVLLCNDRIVKIYCNELRYIAIFWLNCWIIHKCFGQLHSQQGRSWGIL